MNSRSLEVILHCGLGKTGTTAIQRFLHANRLSLKSYGILYPNAGCGTDGAHHKLAQCFGMGAPKESDLQELMQRRLELWEGVAREVDYSITRIVISSEEWPVNLRAYRTEECPHELISRVFPDVKIKLLIYLRRQDEHAASAYNQWVKSARVEASESAFSFCRRYAYDYSALIKAISKGSKPDQIIVRPYVRSEMLRGDVVSDFIATIGADISLTDRHQELTHDANWSLSPLAIEVLRLLNGAEAYDHYSERNKINDNVIKAMEEMGYRVRSRSPLELLTHEEARQILESKSRSNRLVSLQYLGRDELFLSISADECNHFKRKPVEVSEVAEVLARLYLKNV